VLPWFLVLQASRITPDLPYFDMLPRPAGARPWPRPGPCIRVRSGRRARVPGRRGRPPGAGTSGSAGQGILPNGRLLAAASLVKCSGRRPTGLIQTAAASFSEIFP
jgi:hypothetical protein